MESDRIPREQAEARFRRLYRQHGRAILAYAVRRSANSEDAADAVAETFLIAWRRLDAVPIDDPALLWLYGVARRVLANQQRSHTRRERLANRLRHELPVAVQQTPDLGADVVSAALEQLPAEDQEVLRLAAWEELTPAEIATVLDVSQVAARSRLFRARRRLRALVQRDAALVESLLVRAKEVR